MVASSEAKTKKKRKEKKRKKLTPMTGPIQGDYGRQPGKQLSIGAEFGRMQHKRLEHPRHKRGLRPPQLRVQIARVQGDAHHALVPKPLRHLHGVQIVAGLAERIARELGLVEASANVLHVDAAAGHHGCFGGGRSDPDDAHGAGLLGGGRLDKALREELGEEERAEVVDAQLQFVALFRDGPLGRVHDAGVVEEHVELGLAVEELARRGGNGGQVGEVEGQEDEVAGGGGEGGFNFRYGGEGLFLGARGHVYACIFGVEDSGEFFAHACVGARDDVYLVVFVRLGEEQFLSFRLLKGGIEGSGNTFSLRSGSSNSVKSGLGG